MSALGQKQTIKPDAADRAIVTTHMQSLQDELALP